MGEGGRRWDLDRKSVYKVTANKEIKIPLKLACVDIKVFEAKVTVRFICSSANKGSRVSFNELTETTSLDLFRERKIVQKSLD